MDDKRLFTSGVVVVLEMTLGHIQQCVSRPGYSLNPLLALYAHELCAQLQLNPLTRARWLCVRGQVQ